MDGGLPLIGCRVSQPLGVALQVPDGNGNEMGLIFVRAPHCAPQPYATSFLGRLQRLGALVAVLRTRCDEECGDKGNFTRRVGAAPPLPLGPCIGI